MAKTTVYEYMLYQDKIIKVKHAAEVSVLNNLQVYKFKAGKSEKLIGQLKKETGFDEDTIGCFISNYKMMHVCPVATGKWCKGYTMCRNLEEILNEKAKK